MSDSQGKEGIFDLSDDDAGDSQAMRSIHELRASGNRGAFGHEISTLLDDVESHSISGHARAQSALLELCDKLTDAKFRLRFIEGGYEERLATLTRNTDDVIICAAVAAVMMLVLAGDKEVGNAQVMLEGGATHSIGIALNHDKGLTTYVADGMSKALRGVQSGVQKLQSHLLQSKAWESFEPEIVTPVSLGLKALDLVTRRARELGAWREAILDHKLMKSLVRIVDAGAKRMKEQGKGEVGGHFEVEAGLSILECCASAQGCVSDKGIWTEDSIGRLAESLEVAIRVGTHASGQMAWLGLRLIITLANHNVDHCDWLGGNVGLMLGILRCISHGLKEGQGSATVAGRDQLDLVVLGLGAMINLTESSALVRQAVADQGRNLLEDLVDAFRTNRGHAPEADSLEASQTNVAHGYLAVLLAHLCRLPALKQVIALRLPDQSLGAVTEAIEEFTAYHKVADKINGGNADYASFTERLQAVAAQMRRLE